MSDNGLTITPWDSAEPPTEASVRGAFEAEGLRPQRWSSGPGDVYPAHRHSYHKLLIVVEGSISFGLPGERRSVMLRPGDRMDLPAGIEHDAVVGPEGVVCLETARE